MSTTSSMSTNHYSSGQRKSSGKRSAVRGTTNVRYVTVTAMLSAIAFILMFLDFSVPIMPSFIQMDLSELPALIGSFALGPVCGVVVCLVKNLLHLMITSTGGVGELSNFVLRASGGTDLPEDEVEERGSHRLSGGSGHHGFGQLPLQLFHHVSGIRELYAHGHDHRGLPADSSLRG